eukprot:387987_1
MAEQEHEKLVQYLSEMQKWTHGTDQIWKTKVVHDSNESIMEFVKERKKLFSTSNKFIYQLIDKNKINLFRLILNELGRDVSKRLVNSKYVKWNDSYENAISYALDEFNYKGVDMIRLLIDYGWGSIKLRHNCSEISQSTWSFEW